MRNQDKRTRQMLMVAAALGQNISDLWAIYTELFEEVDLDDPETRELMYGLLAEMENNLYEISMEVDEQIYQFTGVDEYVPNEEVEDFESSILRDIDKLGSIDLEELRMEE